MFNAIAQAFVNADANYAAKAKRNGQFKDGWSASLSFKTYNALKAQGIMS